MPLTLLQTDITTVKADAIVNAANTSLLGGGGVDGAIHRKGGPQILEDCMAIRARQGGCQVGQAVSTRAGKLSAQHVIHTVGPVWNGGIHNEEDLLSGCYKSSLVLAEQIGAQTVAFPNISTGIYRFPKAHAAQIAIASVTDYLQQNNDLIMVIFVCFDTENFELYQTLLKTKRFHIMSEQDGRYQKNIQIGFSVEVVQKHHQRTGELTEGMVKRILTKSPEHPHGIKVLLESGEVGRVKNVLA